MARRESSSEDDIDFSDSDDSSMSLGSESSQSEDETALDIPVRRGKDPTTLADTHGAKPMKNYMPIEQAR